MKIKITLLTVFICLSLGLQSGCSKGEVELYRAPKVDPTYINEITSLEMPAKVEFTDIDLKGLSNKPYGWGMKKEKNAPPLIDAGAEKLLGIYQGYYMGKKEDEKVLYLTFDEGYENGYTSAILDVLKEGKVPAAFFVTGPYMKGETQLIRRMVNEGHIVGNHTQNHPSMPEVDDNKKLEDELLELDRQFAALTGKSMEYLRPPKGEFSQRTLAISSNLGYKTVFWSFAYRDWLIDEQKGAQYAFDSVVPYLHDGAIILLHAVSKDNANALKDIIAEAKNQGYRFASLDELE